MGRKPIDAVDVSFLSDMNRITWGNSISDDDLDKIIVTLNHMIVYFKARGDLGLLVTSLRLDLEKHEGYRNARKTG